MNNRFFLIMFLLSSAVYSTENASDPCLVDKKCEKNPCACNCFWGICTSEISLLYPIYKIEHYLFDSITNKNYNVWKDSVVYYEYVGKKYEKRTKKFYNSGDIKMEYVYDSEQRLINSIATSGKGDTLNHEEYMWDKEGRLAKTIFNGLKRKFIYEGGDKDIMTVIPSDDYYAPIFRYTYDRRNRTLIPKKGDKNYKNFSLSPYNFHTYVPIKDSAENYEYFIKYDTIISNNDTSVAYVFQDVYTLCSDGNYIPPLLYLYFEEEFLFSVIKNGGYWKDSVVYYENGERMTKKFHYFDGIKVKAEYTYDSEQRLINSIAIDSDGDTLNHEEYVWDKEGRLAKTIFNGLERKFIYGKNITDTIKVVPSDEIDPYRKLVYYNGTAGKIPEKGEERYREFTIAPYDYRRLNVPATDLPDLP